jgi:hypothetical protein
MLASRLPNQYNAIMKTYLWFGLVLLTALPCLSQTNGVPIPGATDAVPNVELSKLLLAVIVPAVVALGRTLVTKIPKPAIPVIAIALGALADYAGSLLGAWHGSFVVGAVMGAAGIGLREVGHNFLKRA